jgi:hypothetical protein
MSTASDKKNLGHYFEIRELESSRVNDDFFFRKYRLIVGCKDKKFDELYPLNW